MERMFAMVGNVQNIRRYHSASRKYGVAAKRNQLRRSISERAGSQKSENAQSRASDIRFDMHRRLSSNLKNAVNSGSGTISSSDYRARAKQAVTTLTKYASDFDSNIDKALAGAGVPKNVSFKFDYETGSRKAVITEISDEKYTDKVQSVLDKAFKHINLDMLADGSNILNGNAAQVYYPLAEKSLKSCFGQDISELSLSDDGRILGANAKLQKALNVEKYDKNFDATKYGFKTKQLGSVLKRLISERPIEKNVSHMVYENGSFKTADGKISIGKNCPVPPTKTESEIVRTAAAGRWWEMDLWADNEKLF